MMIRTMGMTIMGPGPNETGDDYEIRVFHQVKMRDGNRTDLHPFPLTPNLILRLKAISELFDIKEWSLKEIPKPQTKTDISRYKLNESVYRDLEVFPYGTAPWVPHLFPVLDSFSVVGKQENDDLGFIIDFCDKEIRPTKALAYSTTMSPHTLIDISKEVFKLPNEAGESGYVTKAFFKDKLETTLYGLEENIESTNFCVGNLDFKGRAKTQGEVIEKFMTQIKDYTQFKPELYVFKRYNFPIDFSPKEGKEKFDAGLKDLRERILQTQKEKETRYAWFS
jgi:hypothetical protein